MLRFILVFMSLLPTSRLDAAPPAQVAVGQVVEVSGAAEVLRNPVKNASEQWRQTVQARGYVVAAFEGRYWESRTVVPTLKLYYGDRISTRSSQHVDIQLNDGIKLTLAPETVIKLSRTIIKEQNQSMVQRWVSIISGAIRAKAKSSKEKDRTKFRSGSIAMGVRGTEFVVKNSGGNAQLLTIEGEVAVREISREEQEIFDQYTEQLESGTEASATEAQRERLQDFVRTASEVPVRAGMKIEAPAPAIGMALTAPPVALKPQPILAQDFHGLQIKDLKPVEAPTEAPTPPAPPKPDVMPVPFDRHVAIANLMMLGMNIHLSDNSLLKLGSSGVGLEYRWLPFRYMDVGAFFIFGSRFDGAVNQMYPGATSGTMKNSLQLYGLRLGGRYTFFKFIVGAGLSIGWMSDLQTQFETSTGSLYVHYKTKLNPMVGLMLGYSFAEHLHLLGELTGASVVLTPEDVAVPTQFDRAIEHGVSLARLGIGWSF